MIGSTDEENVIAKLLSENEENINWRYTGPFDKTKQIVRMDNLLHLAAKTGDIDKFLSIFQKSVKSNVSLLEYNRDHENPFHTAAEMGRLSDVVKKIFKYLESEETNPGPDPKTLEDVKSYIRNALGNRCALSNSKRTPLDMVSKEVRKEVRKIAGIKDSFICNRKFHLCLYIVGAIACIAALCLSLYFLYLSSQAFALSSIAGIASGGVAYLSAKAFGEIYDSHDASTLVENLSTEGVARMANGI